MLTVLKNPEEGFNFICHSDLSDGETRESMTLKFYNSDFTTTNAKLVEMLRKANLEDHGFQRDEFRTMLSAGNATGHSIYKMTLYYYKMVDCSKVMQVVLEIDKLFPGQ